MTSLEVKLMALLEVGAPLGLADVGGEGVIHAEVEPGASAFFADVAVLLLDAWDSLDDRKAAEAFIVTGLRVNRDRAGHTRVLTRLVEQPIGDLRPYVAALDARARDSATHDILRVDAAAWLLRLALVDARWKHMALAALTVLEDVDDVHAEPMVSRLAAAAYETFREPEALSILDRQIDRSPLAVQAKTERGIIALAEALDQNGPERIGECLVEAERLLRTAVAADESRRDSRIYLIVAQALGPLAEGRAPTVSLVDELKQEAVVRALWDRTAPGYEWLLPSPAADLDWVPVVDDLQALATDLVQPSWFDAARTMDNVLRAYLHNRSIRNDFGSTARLIQPAVEAAFVRERGLLAHLDQWIVHRGGEAMDVSDATQLRANIRAQIEGAPPGKPRRAVSGRTPFSTPSRPM
ncbi:hypothetical protein [Brevundimonas sp. PAMC22021]|uniref:hypothetical protein n=1 Tax=Brevundimonas sp. PAMC22021 TaxID=2861285 RepID=UPI001C62CE4C|nr:hypothetical protein [Brevundimonas sp. PAMC22021]QYF86957.1 hypothetical protein KY493_00025 [Brevundimonas sp. PAMC22021]